MKARIVNFTARPTMDGRFLIRVCHKKLWIVTEPLFISEAVLTPEQAEGLIVVLKELVEHVRKAND